jgi:DNA-binding MarR family transcriptional regulator
MEDKRSPLIKLINKLYRYTQSYTDDTLKRFNLSSGTYPYLLMLSKNEGISQNQISKKLNVDKAMSARAIKRLIDLGYIKKDVDEEDSRAYKLFLTDNAKAVIPEVIGEIDMWVGIISKDSGEEEKKIAVEFLSKALINAKRYRLSNE